MKKIDAWKTDDGNVWEIEAAAEMHENRKAGERLIVNVYHPQMVECATDLIDFLTEYKITILRYYELTEK